MLGNVLVWTFFLARCLEMAVDRCTRIGALAGNRCRTLLRRHWTLCHGWISQDDARHKHAMGPSDLNGQGTRQPDSLISITVLKAGTPFKHSRNLLWLWVPLIFTSLMIADSTPCSPLTLLYCCALQNCEVKYTPAPYKSSCG